MPLRVGEDCETQGLGRSDDQGDVSCGIFFVATGERCRREAADAARFVARTNPGCPITMFTDDVEATAALGVPAECVALANPHYSFVDKIAGFLAAPYDRNLFLDGDAFLEGSAQELFRLLDRFDLAAAHAPGRSGARIHSYENAELPSTFPQLNTGVVSFRRSPVLQRTFERWAEVYESGLALAVLPPEWNALAGAGYYSGPIQVLHEHGHTDKTAQAAIWSAVPSRSASKRASIRR